MAAMPRMQHAQPVPGAIVVGVKRGRPLECRDCRVVHAPLVTYIRQVEPGVRIIRRKLDRTLQPLLRRGPAFLLGLQPAQCNQGADMGRVGTMAITIRSQRTLRLAQHGKECAPQTMPHPVKIHHAIPYSVKSARIVMARWQADKLR